MMVLAVGSSSYLGFGGETTYGTAGTIDQWLKVISMNPSDAKPNFVSRSRRSSAPKKIYFGQKRAEMELVAEELYTGTELFWHSLLGGYTFSADTPVASAHTHTFLFGGSYPTGITLEPYLGLTGAYAYQLLGMQVTKARIEITEEQPLAITWSFVGQQEATAPVTASSPTYPADDLLLPNDVTALTLGGTAANVLSGFVEITNPRAASRMHYGAGAVAEPVVNGPLSIQFQLTMEWEANTVNEDAQELYADFKSETTSGAMALNFQGPLITGATYNTWGLTLPEVTIVGETPTVQDDDIVQSTITGIGTIGGGGAPMTLILVNETGSQVT